MESAKKLIQKLADERIKEIQDSQEQLEYLIDNKKISLYRDSEEYGMHPIGEDDLRWIRFCEEVLVRKSTEVNPTDFKSIEREIIDQLIKRDWAEEVIFVWHERRLDNSEYEKLFRSRMIFIKHLPNKVEKHIMICNDKRWKKVRVHFLL